MDAFEITIQRQAGDSWPVVVEQRASGAFLPVRAVHRRSIVLGHTLAHGRIWHVEKAVMDACGRAVEMEPSEGEYRDSRGIARALIGDPAGAIDDFEFYIAWAKEQSAEANKDAIRRREQWIAALRAGKQPFEDTTLEKLRVEMR